jgi:hypothetical protein
MFSMVSTLPIPDRDHVLVLAPAEDGLGCVGCITRRCNNGSVMWTALPQSTHFRRARRLNRRA